MSRSVFWDEEKIQELIFLCGQYSIKAHINKNKRVASDILISAGRFIDFLSTNLHCVGRVQPSISDRWLDVKLTSILYAIDNAKYSDESERIILSEISLVLKFLDINNLNLNEHHVGDATNLDDEIPDLILPEPFDSNDFFY